MNTVRAFSLPLLALFLLNSNPMRATEMEMVIPPGYFAQNIGKSSLADPSGVTHTREDVAGRVVVAIFSAPDMSQGDRQEKWSDLLSTQPETRVPMTIALVLVEDMTQAGLFRGMALSSMKKQFAPHQRPFLILDQTGEVFKKFGVPQNHTVILIYDKAGKLRDVEQNLDDEAGVISRIKAITKKLLAE